MKRPPVDRISWGADLPPRQVPVYDILIPRYGDPVKGWILAPQMLTVMTHWWCDRTTPHVTPREMCEPCNIGRHRPRFNGFLPLYDKDRKVFIAQLTQEAVRKCPTLKDKSINLRGSYLVLERMKPGERSEVKATLTQMPEKERLAADPGILPVLLNTWGWHPDTRLDDLGESSGPPKGDECYPI